MSFREVCSEADLWVGEKRGVVVDGVRVLLLRTDAGVFAYRDRCPHLGVPLSQGKLDGCTLTCAAHHFQYDVRTGRGINPAGMALAVCAVRCSSGIISVDVGAGSSAAHRPGGSGG